MEVRPTPKQGGEKDTLLAFLDNNRAIMLWKLEGLSAGDAGRPMVPSGTNLIGVVKHLAWVERWWFEDFFAGRPTPDYPWSDEDPDADFRAEPDDTPESVSRLYTEAVAVANEIIAQHDLDDLSAKRSEGSAERYTLRWVMGHMLEETARHAGHADILREMIDGVTGYMP